MVVLAERASRSITPWMEVGSGIPQGRRRSIEPESRWSHARPGKHIPVICWLRHHRSRHLMAA